VLFFGRMEPYKGLPVLLSAMERVWAVRPETQLCVSGVGPESKSVPTDPRITATDGYVPEDRVDEMFRASSLVVLPYVQASQSGVGARAIGRGVPAIVSEAGALPDLAVAPSLIVPANNAPALADAIVTNLEQQGDLRERVLQRAREKFAWSVVAEQSERLYRGVLGGALS
jgi:glycosyltransferase involved in cell wall biosynthesis